MDWTQTWWNSGAFKDFIREKTHQKQTFMKVSGHQDESYLKTQIVSSAVSPVPLCSSNNENKLQLWVQTSGKSFVPLIYPHIIHQTAGLTHRSHKK